MDLEHGHAEPALPSNSISRRGLIIGGTALGVGAMTGYNLADPTAASAASGSPAILKAAALHVNVAGRGVTKLGVAANFASTVSGNGIVRPATKNLFAQMLPFTGASVSANRPPSGLTWHSDATPKTLVSADANKIVFKAKTTSALPNYFGGVRTAFDVVQPGQTVLLSFKADISGLTGNVNASIRVFLLRTSDQKTTDGVRAYNAQESENLMSTIRIKAPTGGSGGYRVVFTVEAGASQAGQQVTVSLSEFMMVVEPGSPKIGARYAIPNYVQKTASAQNFVLSPGAPAGEYHVVIRTDQFGWAAETTTLTSTSSKIDFKNIFGTTVNMNVNEVFIVAKSKWVKGWLDSLSPVVSWTPARYLNIDNSHSKSRPESPNRLSRMTGMVAGVSSAATARVTATPTLAAPPVTWAVSYNPKRLSHSAFEADQDRYIGDPDANAGVRSEVIAGDNVQFNQDIWISFWTRTNSTLKDPLYDRSAAIFQYRYAKNATGDSSRLSPDLALEQIPGNRFRLRYRSDKGKPVLSGNSIDNPAIVMGTVDPVPYVVGQWSSVVVRVRFSATGGGYVGFWYNGVQKFSANVPVGYNRALGPMLHYGAYKFSDSKTRIEFQHLEHGTRNLSSRIKSPLAI